jgi:hypothetical protein
MEKQFLPNTALMRASLLSEASDLRGRVLALIRATELQSIMGGFSGEGDGGACCMNGARVRADRAVVPRAATPMSFG